MTQIEKYGYCIVPKDSRVFHKGHIHKNADSIFFGVNPITAHVNPGPINKIQIWRFKADVQLLFMIINVAHFSWTKSAIVEIYRNYFPNEKPCTDIDIKYNDRSKRKKLIGKLKEQNIIGWFSSYDDTYELEICLFNDETLFNIIELDKEVEMNELYNVGFVNPLKKMLLFPNKNFFKISDSELLNFQFQRYKKHVYDCIEEDVKLGSSKKYSQNANYTLRMKLKI
jgi:hypothetical protein